jgi:hypothetical protein
MFRHPNYYKKLRASLKKEAISPDESTDSDGRAPGPGLTETQASSDKRQAPSRKHQAPSRKRQAP